MKLVMCQIYLLFLKTRRNTFAIRHNKFYLTDILRYKWLSFTLVIRSFLSKCIEYTLQFKIECPIEHKSCLLTIYWWFLLVLLMNQIRYFVAMYELQFQRTKILCKSTITSYIELILTSKYNQLDEIQIYINHRRIRKSYSTMVCEF